MLLTMFKSQHKSSGEDEIIIIDDDDDEIIIIDDDIHEEDLSVGADHIKEEPQERRLLTRGRALKCNTCNANFQEYECLLKHQFLHSALKCNICNKEYKSYYTYSQHLARACYVSKVSVKPGNYVRCNRCSGKRFPNQKSLLMHNIRCHKSDIFKCPFCKGYFDDEDTFNQHSEKCTVW